MEQFDVIVHCHNIISLDQGLLSLGNTLAVKDQRIAAIGEASDFTTARAGVHLDLRNADLFPGFVESHMHLAWTGLIQTQINCGHPKVKRIADILNAIRERAISQPPGTWILGHHWDDTLLEEQRPPTLQELSEAAPRHPVYLLHNSGHLALANQAAFDCARIGLQNNIPGIKRTPGGALSGELHEAEALESISQYIPAPTTLEMQEAIKAATAICHSHGVTAATDAAMGLGDPTSVRSIWQAYQHADQTHALRVRLACYSRILDQSTFVSADPPTNFLESRGVKLFADGSIQGHTARLLEGYHDQPQEHGVLLKSPEELAALIKFYDQKGQQVIIHGNGDGAIEAILQAYSQVLSPNNTHRHRIEHAQLAHPDHLKIMKHLGVLPNFFIGHVYYYGDRHRDRFLGQDRARQLNPLATALQLGMPFALHSDSPVTPVNPLASIETAVTRRTSMGKFLGEDQRIPISAAWRAYTDWAAYLGFRETHVGSLRVGAWADFIALNHNPFETEPDTFWNTVELLHTGVAGEIVYSRT